MIKIEQKTARSPLTRYIRKISVFSSAGSIESIHRLIPCGCTYLSYNHRDIPSFVNSKRVDPSQRLQITGPKIDNNIYVEYNGELSQVLIEFMPAGFYYLFHASPANFQNKLINFSEFLPGNNLENLTNQLLATDDPDTQLDILQDYLIEVSFHALPFCDYLEEAIGIIDSNFGDILIKDLAEAVNKSERQLNRQFLKIVGIPPKIYSKILQLHYVINLMNRKEYSSIKEISYIAKFYDQSHFDRRFKELVGITPNEFLVSREHNALKYYTDLTKPGVNS